MFFVGSEHFRILNYLYFNIINYIYKMYLFLRSKPVVNIEKTLTLTPNAIDFKAQDCKRYSWWDNSKIYLYNYLNYFVVNFFFLIFIAFWKSFSYITAQSCFTYTVQTPTYNHKLSESILCSSYHMLKYQNDNECPRAIFMSHSRWVCLISDNITGQTPSCQSNFLELFVAFESHLIVTFLQGSSTH